MDHKEDKLQISTPFQLDDVELDRVDEMMVEVAEMLNEHQASGFEGATVAMAILVQSCVGSVKENEFDTPELFFKDVTRCMVENATAEIQTQEIGKVATTAVN